VKGFAVCALVLCLGFAAGETFFEENFSGDWESRWVQSEHKDDLGKFATTAGKYNDGSGAVGLQTSQDAKFYDISAKFNSFSNTDKTMVVQYAVKHEQGIDCGGAYLKLGGGDFDGKKFQGDTAYNVMFGPDICGMTKRTHLIFNYKDDNLLKTKDMRTESDELTHVYTLIVNPDNTFEVQIDGSKVEDGKLADGWKFLEPKEIEDSEDKKPADWVNEAEMDDPEDKKPEGHDDIPAKISDPKATKPDDWDEESDGAWEAPQIDNPDYKGAWKAKRIPNPAYKGVWAPKKIANPKYVDDSSIGKYADFSWVGIDVWQVKSGTIFSNLLITDSVDTAKAAQEKIKTFQDAEKKAKEEADAAKAKKDKEEREAKDAEEAAKKAEEDAKKAEEDAKKADEPAAEETKKEEL
jgi:calreticulin